MVRERGLTLIEMLAGLALTGLLVAALFQSLGVVVGSERRLAAATPTPEATPWRDAVRRQVRSDLDQALSAGYADGVLRIEGWCGRDVEAGTRDHDAVAVTYRVEPGTGWLIREQAQLGEAHQRPQQRELVAAGVADLALDRSGRLTLRFLESGVRPLIFNVSAEPGGGVAR